MALDNPSYFSLLGNPISPELSEGPELGSSGRSFVTFFKKRPSRMGTSTSTSTSGATCALLMADNNKNLVSAEECQPMLSRSTNSATNGPRRSFRNLFRSLSANTDNEKTLQILKGDPRPADVAPPSPYLPHRSHSHSDHDRKNRPNRQRTLKSASELLSNDMIFCGLPGEDPANNNGRANANGNGDGNGNGNRARYHEDNDDEDTDTGEVFLGINDARYYNLSATLPAPGTSGNRRHSIGCSSNFISKDQNLITRRGAVIQTEGFIRAPDTLAPPIPVDQVDCGKISKSGKCEKHKSKGSRSRSGGTKIEGTNASLMEEREDVVFISSKDSEASALWVNYLTACFEQISRQQGRPPFKVRHVAIEDATAISTTVQDKISKARLQIIVVCPILLEKASNKPEQASALAKQLAPERVLAMMLGVHDGHLTESQKTALITYSQWRKFFVKDQDETFVGEFLGAAVAILGSTAPAALKSDKTTFSVHPKKVKMGQSRVLVILNDPLRPEDTFNVIVDRCGEGTEITQVKKRNPYTLQFSIPEKCLEVSMLVGVRIIVNGIPQGVRQVKCESRLRELDQILRAHDNPLEFMCQTFGFSSGDREQLDNWMVHAFQKNVPPRFNLLATPSGSAPLQKNTISQEEYPTLLHFAARFGLEKLAWQLLDCPGGEVACDLKNVSELTPAELADQAGHTKLAHQLRGYMQMNEFTNMYSYLKVISENTSGNGANNESTPVQLNTLDTEQDKEDYCQPRPISEAYLVPPAARPVITSASILCTPPQLPPPNPPTSPNSCEMNYSIVPPPTPVLGPLFSSATPTPSSAVNFEANGLSLPLQGYLKMHPAGPKLSSAPITAPLMALKPTMSQSLRKDFPINREDFMNANLSNLSGSLNRSTSYPGTKSREASGPQDELLEIITDFKNNVFTISEVERLVENWRNRNDVQQSFKDKQRQLASMRDEYERIQKKIKEEMKAPTPFDRFKKLFTKSKKDAKESSSSQDDDSASTHSKIDNKSNGTLSDRRPISSLSLHSVSSSSSSGRMSVISGCSGTSLGDSGTHSDTEDRRLRNSREDKGGMMTYEIPPAPKPFTGRYSPLRYTPSPRSSTNCIDEHRRPAPDQYYISFPVSGLPVHSFNADGTSIEPKTPSSPCDHSFGPPMSIPEEQSHPELNDNNDSQKQIKEMNQLSIPSPPPSPPTHIPLDYMNITPTVNSNDLKNVLSDINNSCDNKKNNTDDASQMSCELNKVINKDYNIPDETVNLQDGHIQSNHVENVPLGVDVVDAPVLHDYMNIQPCDQDPRVVGVIPKKPPAPPVPPRAPSKK